MRALIFSSFVNLVEESQFPKYDKFSMIFNDVMRLKAMLLVMTKAQMSLVVILLAVQTVGSWPPTRLRSREGATDIKCKLHWHSDTNHFSSKF